MRKKKINPDRYYIVDLTDLASPKVFHFSYEERSLAKASIEFYYEDGVFDVYKGTQVILLKLKMKRSDKPKYPPNIMRGSNPSQTITAKRSRGLGIRSNPFKKLWEPLPTGRQERRKKVREGRSRVREKFLK